MIKKFGLLTLSWTEQNKLQTRSFDTFDPLIKYLCLPPTKILKNYSY